MRLRASLALLVGLVLAGCELQTELNVDVDDDGAGTVEIGVGLDDDARERQPDVLEDLALDDLLAAGWTATEPTREADGLTWVRLRHGFEEPAQVGPLVAEVAGEHGPFRDFTLAESSSFTETRYEFAGVVDFTGGVDGLTEGADLGDALDAEAARVIEEQLGQALDEVVGVQVAVRLPGEVASNAPTTASNGAVWRPSVVEPEPVELAATGAVSRTPRLVAIGVGAIVGLALVLFVSIRVAAWRCRRTP